MISNIPALTAPVGGIVVVFRSHLRIVFKVGLFLANLPLTSLPALAIAARILGQVARVAIITFGQPWHYNR